MKLETINRWLRRAGLLLVVQVDDGSGDEPTIFRLVRAKSYRPRSAHERSKE